MVSDNKHCSVCGREKEEKLIPYINKICYIDCSCETRLKEQEEKAKREKAIDAYIRLRTRSSHILKREEGALFDGLTVDKDNAKAIEGAKYVLKLLLEGSGELKNGLVLSGTRGSGKTYISAAIINEYNRLYPFSESVISQLISQQSNGYGTEPELKVKADCKFVKQTELIRAGLKVSFREESQAVDEYKNAKLLVIDDLGVSFGDKEKIRGVLYDVIDYRYSQALPIIITTNLSAEELREYVGERAFDRLRSSCFFLSLSSKESRRKAETSE